MTQKSSAYRIEIDFGRLSFPLREVGGEQVFQSVQRHVRQDWRNNATLRCAFICRVETTVFHVSGLQPLLENGFVHGDMGKQPVMRNPVEARRMSPSKIHSARSLRQRAMKQASIASAGERAERKP